MATFTTASPTTQFGPLSAESRSSIAQQIEQKLVSTLGSLAERESGATALVIAPAMPELARRLGRRNVQTEVLVPPDQAASLQQAIVNSEGLGRAVHVTAVCPTDATLPIRAYDLIVCRDVLHTVNPVQRNRLFSRIAMALTDNGRLYVYQSAPEDLQSVWAESGCGTRSRQIEKRALLIELERHFFVPKVHHLTHVSADRSIAIEAHGRR